jgi:hypothetical protein
MIQAEWLCKLRQSKASVDRLLQQAETRHTTQHSRERVAQSAGQSRQLFGRTGAIGEILGYFQANGQQDQLRGTVAGGHVA